MGLFDTLDKVNPQKVVAKKTVQNTNLFDQLDTLQKQHQQGTAQIAQAKKTNAAQQATNFAKIQSQNTFGISRPLSNGLSQIPKDSVFAQMKQHQQQLSQQAAEQQKFKGDTVNALSQKQAQYDKTHALPVQQIAPSSQTAQGQQATNINGNPLQKLQNVGGIALNVANALSAPATAARAAIPIATGKIGTVTSPANSNYYSLMNAISDLSGKNVDNAISSVPVVGGVLDTAANIVGDTVTDPMSFALGGGFGGDIKSLSKIGKAADLEEALNSANSVKRAAELANDSKMFAAEKVAQAGNAAKNATPILENGKSYATVGDKNGITNVEQNAIDHAQNLMGNGATSTADSAVRDTKTVSIANKIANGESLTQEEASHLAQNIKVEKPQVVEPTAGATQGIEIPQVKSTVTIPNEAQKFTQYVPGENASVEYGKALGANTLSPEKVQAGLANESEQIAKYVQPEKGISTASAHAFEDAKSNLSDIVKNAKTAVSDSLSKWSDNATPKANNQLGKDIRGDYASFHDEHNLLGIQFANNMRKIAPNEQDAVQLWLDANGDKDYLKKIVGEGAEKHPWLNEKIPNSKITYQQAYQQASNLSPNAQSVANLAKEYYAQNGQLAKDYGMFSDTELKDNYANRIWQPGDGKKIRSEAAQTTLNPNTSHAKQRVFEHIADGLDAGKKPATLNAADNLSLNNGDMANAFTARKLASDLKDSGLGRYTTEKVGAGESELSGLSKTIPIAGQDGKNYMVKQSFVVSEPLGNALKAITESDNLKKIPLFNNWLKMNAFNKRFNLSYSVFHPISLGAQALYNFEPIKFARVADELSSKGSQEMERFAVKYGVTLSKSSENLDVLNKLSSDTSAFKRIQNLPGIKQLGLGSDALNKLTFDGMQTKLKTTDFNIKALDWVQRHPNATQTEQTRALRSIGEEINNVYGGLNFLSNGTTRTTQSTMKLWLLASDWTTSAIKTFNQAFNPVEVNKAATGIADKFVLNPSKLLTPGAKAAQLQYAKGIIGGFLATEALNHITTGHFTDKNSAGHELQWEVRPGIYIGLFRSGLGDVVKEASDIAQYGTLGGTAKMAQGKLASIPKVLVGLAGNRNYYGQQLYSKKNSNLQNSENILQYIGQEASPVPFGASNAYNYNTKTTDTGATKVLGNALVDTGIASYSPNNSSVNSAEPYSGNWMYGLTPQGQAENQLSQTIKNYKKTVTQQNATKNESNSNYQAKKKLTSQESTALKSFMSMSVENRQKLLASLSFDQRQIITSQLDKLGISY